MAAAETEIVEKFGDHWEGEVSRSQTLIRRSLRWNTPASSREHEMLSADQIKAISSRELAIMITRRNMLDADKPVSNTAIRNLILMEGQNQRDQLGPIGTDDESGDMKVLIQNLNITLEAARDNEAIVSEFDDAYGQETPSDRDESGHHGGRD